MPFKLIYKDLSNKTSLLVKFSGYSRAKEILETKTLYAATADQFNDLLELPIILKQSKHYEAEEKISLKKELTGWLSEGENLEKAKNYFKKNNCADLPLESAFLSDITSLTKKELLENDDYIPIILTAKMALTEGVLCLSSSHVFESAAANVMLGHYAEKQTGLALIFVNKNPDITQVEYGKKDSTTYLWANMPRKHFLIKTNEWNYENEFRIELEPGYHPFEHLGLDLAGIFYTNRILADDLSDLKKIAKKHHPNIFLECIMHSVGSNNPGIFRLKKAPRYLSVSEFLKEIVENMGQNENNN